ncbi:MAG: DCC1-like thiol-disulfide oxidoreductase family protein [Verrucomicrobiota bacterium]
MKSSLQVASPPAKPLMIFDGGCNLCALWIRRWQHATGDSVDYLPFQDPRVAARFPELRRDRCEAAVQLIEPEGDVYAGAEAVFRALAHKSQEHWLLDGYYYLPGFGRASEWGYRLVARHRGFFALLTRMGWGRHAGASSHFLVRQVFLRLLGIIYLISFLSLGTQIKGLVGGDGIFPVRSTLAMIRLQLDSGRVGLDRYHLLPTLCWFNASDRFLQFQCAAGTVLALLVIAGIACYGSSIFPYARSAAISSAFRGIISCCKPASWRSSWRRCNSCPDSPAPQRPPVLRSGFCAGCCFR